MSIPMKKRIDVAAAVIFADDKIFAARRKPGSHLAGYWEFPGGKIEADETPEQCLIRELQEELCITTEVGQYIGESLHDYGTKVVRLMAYKVIHIFGDFKLNDHDQFCWLGINELESINWAPADIPLVDLCRELLSDG